MGEWRTEGWIEVSIKSMHEVAHKITENMSSQQSRSRGLTDDV